MEPMNYVLQNGDGACRRLRTRRCSWRGTPPAAAFGCTLTGSHSTGPASPTQYFAGRTLRAQGTSRFLLSASINSALSQLPRVPNPDGSTGRKWQPRQPAGMAVSLLESVRPRRRNMPTISAFRPEFLSSKTSAEDLLSFFPRLGGPSEGRV